MFSFITTPELCAYFITITVLALSPGPDVLFISSQSLKGGRLHGVFAALGVSLGILFYVFATAFGMSQLFKTYPVLFPIIQNLGGAYLLYLSYKAFRSTSVSFKDVKSVPLTKALSKTFWQGTLTTSLNPKVGLFFFTFLPQFTNEQSIEPLYLQLLVLGILFVTVGTVVDMAYAFLISHIRPYLMKSSTIQKNIQRLTGFIFAVLGIKVILG